MLSAPAGENVGVGVRVAHRDLDRGRGSRDPLFAVGRGIVGSWNTELISVRVCADALLCLPASVSGMLALALSTLSLSPRSAAANAVERCAGRDWLTSRSARRSPFRWRTGPDRSRE
jgi:hypothetical protein